MRILILVLVVALCGCEKKEIPKYNPPTAAERFKEREGSYFQPETGRFTPIHVQGEVAILDTWLGNVWYYDFSKAMWVKIVSPLASESFLIPKPKTKAFTEIDFEPESTNAPAK